MLWCQKSEVFCCFQSKKTNRPIPFLDISINYQFYQYGSDKFWFFECSIFTNRKFLYVPLLYRCQHMSISNPSIHPPSLCFWSIYNNEHLTSCLYTILILFYCFSILHKIFNIETPMCTCHHLTSQIPIQCIIIHHKGPFLVSHWDKHILYSRLQFSSATK